MIYKYKNGGTVKLQNAAKPFESATAKSYFSGLKDYLLHQTKSFTPSLYKPTKGSNIQQQYYTRPGLKEEVVLNLFGGTDSNIKGPLGNYFFKDFDDAYNRLSLANESRTTSNGTLGKYGVSAGIDDRGRYISFIDTFDHVFIPGKGIPIYDRIYEDEIESLYNPNLSAVNEGDWITRSPELKKRLKHKFDKGGIVKLQNAGSIPEYNDIEQIAKYNREHGTNFWKMSQVLEHDKQQAQQKTQDEKKSFWKILAGHPESAGEAILNKTIETANNAELPETRKKIYNDTAKSELGTTAGSLLTLPMLGELSTYGLLGGSARLAGGMTGSAAGSYVLGKAGELGDRTFGTTWMKPAGQIIGGFAGWPTGSNIAWRGAAKIAPNRVIGDFISGSLNKNVSSTTLGISDLQRNIEAGKIGWAPATTKTLWHNSNDPVSELKVNFPAWDVTERKAPLGHIWSTGEETTIGFIGNRPYHYSADITLSKPMIQLNEAIGSGKNASRNEILDFAQKSSADGLHFPNIEDNTLNHQNVYSIFKDVTPKNLNIHFRNPLKKTYSSPKIEKLELSEDIMSSDHVLDELNEFESPINEFLNKTLQDTPKSFQEKFYKELAKNNPSKKELMQQIPFLLDGNPNKEELSHILQDVVSKYDDRVVPFGYHLDNKGNMKVTPGNAAEIAKTYLGIDKGLIDPDLGMITRASTNGETLSTYKGRQTWMGGFGGQGVTMGYHLSANPQIPGTLFVKTLNPNGIRLKARALKGFQTSQLAAAEKALKANEPETAAKAIIDLRKVPEAQDNALIQRLMYSYGDLDPTRLSNTSLKTEIEGLKQRINPEASADITRGLRKTFDKKELIIPETLQYDSRHNIYIGDGSAGRFIGGYYSKHKPIDILDGYSLDRWNQYANKNSKFGPTEDPKFIKLLKTLEQNGYNINEIKDKITSDVLFKLADEKYPGQPSFLRVNDFGGLFESGRKVGKEPKPFFGINRPSGEVPIVYGINRNYLRENLYPVHRLSPEYKQGGILKAQNGTGLAGIPILGNLAKKGFELVAKRSNGAQTKSIPTIIGDIITGRDKSFYNINNSNGSNEIDTYLYGKPYNSEFTGDVSVGPDYTNYINKNYPNRNIKTYNAHFGDTLYIDDKAKSLVEKQLNTGEVVGGSMGRYAHAPSYIVTTEEGRPYDAGGHLIKFSKDENGNIVANMSDIYDFLPEDFNDKYDQTENPSWTRNFANNIGTPFIVRQNNIPVVFKEIVPEYKTEKQKELGDFLSQWGNTYDLKLPLKLSDEQIDEIFDGRDYGDDILDFMISKGYIKPVYKQGGILKAQK